MTIRLVFLVESEEVLLVIEENTGLILKKIFFYLQSMTKRLKGGISLFDSTIKKRPLVSRC